jgi:hypothetical protein
MSQKPFDSPIQEMPFRRVLRENADRANVMAPFKQQHKM